MMLMLQLSLCVAVIQLTSSQSTYDVTEQENGICSCSCLHTENFERTVLAALSQLQKDVAELKAGHTNVKGKLVKR